MKPSILISACLLGHNTKYNGKNNFISKTNELAKLCNFVVICPEMDGGLPCPRDPSEIKGNKVFTSNGKDVTKEYNLGASKALSMALSHNCKYALLKEKSPSCGKSFVYDGSFNSVLVKGMGITAALLNDMNIKVYNENEIDELIKQLK